MGIIKGIFKYGTKFAVGVVTAVIDEACKTHITKDVQKGIDALFDGGSVSDFGDTVIKSASHAYDGLEVESEKYLEKFRKRMSNLSDEQLLKLNTSNYNDLQMDVYEEEKSRRGL